MEVTIRCLDGSIIKENDVGKLSIENNCLVLITRTELKYYNLEYVRNFSRSRRNYEEFRCDFN